MSYQNQIFLSTQQTEVIQAAASSVPPYWRERFLNSIQDQLLGHEPDRVSDDDVVKAIQSVRSAFQWMEQDLYDDCC